MTDRLAFLLGFTGGFQHYVYVADGDYQNVRRLTSQRAIGRPDFSPSGEQVVFPGPVTDDSDGRFGLYVVDLDGQGLRRLTAPTLADHDPAWSPDGKRIAFARQVGNAMDPAATRLFTMPAGGGTPSQIASTPGARDPAWSPDSQRIAFTAGGNLYLVGGATETPAVLAVGGARYPAWSPDGRTIAYVQRLSRSRSRLMTVPATGGSPSVRADHGTQVEDPHWSHDSRTLRYVTYRGQGFDGRADTVIWRNTAGSSPTAIARPAVRITSLGLHPDPPPGIIDPLLAEVTQRTVELSWRNPADADFARVHIRMVAGPTPVTSPTAGTLVYSGRTPAALITSGIEASSTYSFTLFALDTGGSYSRPVGTTVTTPPPRVPDPPAHLEAVPGTRSARITWAAPLNDGGRVITSYTVDVAGGGPLTVSGGTRSVVVESLSAHRAHAITVIAHNELGPSLPATTAVTPDSGAVAGTYTALAPARALDTRSATPALTPTTDRVVQLAGNAGVPASGVAAAAMSVAVVAPTTAGFLKVYPANTAEPNVSTLNFRARQTVANHDVVPLGNGAVSLAVSSGSAHAVLDVAGFYANATGPAGGRLNALAPVRLMDTRTAGGALVEGTTRELQVTGRGGVPTTGVSSVVVVLTGVRPTAGTHLTVFPAGTNRPTASVLNVAAGATTAVLATAKLSADGKVALVNGNGSMHVLVDVLGYHTETAAQPGELYVPVTPTRVLDTRLGVGVRSGRVGAEQTVTLVVRGAAGIPETARTVLLNLTGTQPSTATHITVYPSDRLPPRSSVLNLPAGGTVANLILAKLSPSGALTLRNAAGSVHLVGDVRGYFAPSVD